MPRHSSALLLLLAGLCVGAWANEAEKSETSVLGKEFVDEDEENGEGKLYFTGTGYTINLIPQAIILGVLAFLAVYFLGLDLFGSNTSGYGAPSGGYGAPAASYGAPAASYGAPEASYGAPAPSYAAPAPSYAAPSYAAPAASYDAPSSGYTASGRYYAAADGLGSSFDDAAARRRRSAF